MGQCIFSGSKIYIDSKHGKVNGGNTAKRTLPEPPTPILRASPSRPGVGAHCAATQCRFRGGGHCSPHRRGTRTVHGIASHQLYPLKSVLPSAPWRKKSQPQKGSSFLWLLRQVARPLQTSVNSKQIDSADLIVGDVRIDFWRWPSFLLLGKRIMVFGRLDFA